MIIFIIVTAIILFLILLGYNAFASYKWHNNNLGKQYKSEAEHFYWYFIYYNPDDPRLFKPRGGGYTLNFARATVIIIGGYIFAIIYL
ncbi:hypothetical protein CK503_15145 [Aliifodinibius salipaludis]|uniref:DUF5808 domain-containing protein n=1 Tax=Fodinibius salipaludis TaxID=2032627 RepID=A0A2A2G7L1_9BACT|nr:hypothetical protein [Aliifodinibius salipaludis]PAU92823.1 hypothetical protein CK503_15145 [Aliifodinibius salipaludis]